MQPLKSTTGAVRPTMRDVAQHAGVSHQTVSRVLNGSGPVDPRTRTRVRESIEALGYRRNGLARALKTRRSQRLGVIASDLQERGPSMLVVAIQESALRLGYETSLVGLTEMTPSAVRAAVDRLVEQDVDALLVTVTHAEARSLAEEHLRGIPFVFVEGVTEGTPRSAGTAQRAGARAATEHLLALGHESVVHVAGPASWTEATERQRGWLQAHDELGRAPGSTFEGDWTAHSGYLAGREIARDPAITAVFTANDQMALGLLHALREAGREVPRDVSVVGFDDLPEAAYFAPPLTTVSQDFSALGCQAVELAIRVLGGESQPTAPLVPTELIVRSSTAAPLGRLEGPQPKTRNPDPRQGSGLSGIS